MVTLRSISSRFLEVLSFIIPPKAHVTIHGFPADEGNVVEVVAALSSRYKEKIFWLVDENDAWRVNSSLDNVVLLSKYSLRGLMRYVTAETVFFTHGLFGDTRPQRGRTFVNLWHGDGFKVKKEAEEAKRSLYPAQYTVGCTSLLTKRRAQDFRMPEETILHLGNPRMDQFYERPSEETRARLGLPHNQKYVVWVPTFRANHGAGATKGWSDVGTEAPNPNDAMASVVAELTRRGYAVIIKPHPQDRESRSVENTIVLDNSDLSTAGTTFYGLLGGSAAIITDYSSVWTEYLALDRPIGFVVPDKKQYLQTRGMYPSDLFEWLPGPMIEDASRVSDFVAELTDLSSPAGRRARALAADKLGLIHGDGQTTDDLLDALESISAFARAGGLMPRSARKVSSHAVIQRVKRSA